MARRPSLPPWSELITDADRVTAPRRARRAGPRSGSVSLGSGPISLARPESRAMKSGRSPKALACGVMPLDLRLLERRWLRKDCAEVPFFSSPFFAMHRICPFATKRTALRTSLLVSPLLHAEQPSACFSSARSSVTRSCPSARPSPCLAPGEARSGNPLFWAEIAARHPPLARQSASCAKVRLELVERRPQQAGPGALLGRSKFLCPAALEIAVRRRPGARLRRVANGRVVEASSISQLIPRPKPLPQQGKNSPRAA
jgi:hypothetical protein